MDFSKVLLEIQGATVQNIALAKCIEKAIETGEILPGEKIPTERKISEETGLSRGTVRTALARLEKQGFLEIKKGSGSFAKIPPPKAPCRIAIFGNCLETLIDLKVELDQNVTAENHLFLLESLTSASNAQSFLQGYDLCLVPNNQYENIVAIKGVQAEKLFPITTLASNESLQQIFSLDLNARIGIICRSNEFLATVKGTLITYGFAPEHILSFFEMDYTTATYFPGGIDALISFPGAHIFTSPHFHFRNEAFLRKAGKIIPFISTFDANCMQGIKNRLAEIQGLV